MTITTYDKFNKDQKLSCEGWTKDVIMINFDDEEDPETFAGTELAELINDNADEWEDKDLMRVGYAEGSSGDFFITKKLLNKNKKLKELIDEYKPVKVIGRKSYTIMDKELRKMFSQLKAKCDTSGKRKAYNKLISTFARGNKFNNIDACHDSILTFLVSIQRDFKTTKEVREYLDKVWNAIKDIK